MKNQLFACGEIRKAEKYHCTGIRIARKIPPNKNAKPTRRQKRSVSLTCRVSRSMPIAGKISSSGNGNGTMCVTGLKIGASLGCAGNNVRTQSMIQTSAIYTVAIRVAGHETRAAHDIATKRAGYISAQT